MIAEVVEASIEDYEEGMQACAEATKIWMQVGNLELSSIQGDCRFIFSFLMLRL